MGDVRHAANTSLLALPAAATVNWVDSTLRLDHIGIAVQSIAVARAFYEALGMRAGEVETITHEQVRVAVLRLGEVSLELIEPTTADSIVGRFLQRRGEGMHHVAVYANEIEVKFHQLRKRGIRLASDAIRIGAGGHSYFFVHPASSGGVLIEIVGDAAGSTSTGAA